MRNAGADIGTKRAGGRDEAIAAATEWFDSGGFFDELARRVAYRTESPDPDRVPDLWSYLRDELAPSFEELGFTCEVFAPVEPVESARLGAVGTTPFLIAERHEGDDRPTVFTYGHGDVVIGQDQSWADGRSPWQAEIVGDRIYGRGTADNKGQHTINLAAMRAVLERRGELGFNVVALFETGEECGSAGLADFCMAHADRLKGDVLIASDGPRTAADRPTIFGGSRGAFNFTMSLTLRDGGHHSGNWGGLLTNPGIRIANALASMVDAKGQILVDGWKAAPMPESVREAIGRLEVGTDPGSPEIDPDWGEPGHSPVERVFGTNTFEVLAFETGNPAKPVNAVPPSAVVHGHLRVVVGTEIEDLLPALRKHLDERGFDDIDLEAASVSMAPTRLDPDHPWCRWAVGSIEQTTGGQVDVVPNLGGSLPNSVFADLLGMATIWIPHSYAGCSQHAPNEHVLIQTSRDALQIMTGLWWDLGSAETPTRS